MEQPRPVDPRRPTDPEAFIGFYDHCYGVVAAFFHRRTLCPQATAELTAETFARVWAARARFDPAQGTAIAWTMGIASNLYRRWRHTGRVSTRARSRLSIETPLLVVEDLEHIEGLVDRTELRAALLDALDELSPRLKEAVVLRVGLDLAYDEVAERLGCTVGAARVRVSRALDVLLLKLEGATA